MAARDPEKSRESVRRWYREHRDDYNEERRRRYKADPEVREKARARAQEYREQIRAGKSIERTLYRNINGARTEVYTTGQVAEYIGCSSQMLRNWETKRKWIPPSTFPDKHRLYTMEQVELIADLYDVIMAASGRWKNIENFENVLLTIKEGW